MIFSYRQACSKDTARKNAIFHIRKGGTLLHPATFYAVFFLRLRRKSIRTTPPKMAAQAALMAQP